MVATGTTSLLLQCVAISFTWILSTFDEMGCHQGSRHCDASHYNYYFLMSSAMPFLCNVSFFMFWCPPCNPNNISQQHFLVILPFYSAMSPPATLPFYSATFLSSSTPFYITMFPCNVSPCYVTILWWKISYCNFAILWCNISWAYLVLPMSSIATLSPETISKVVQLECFM